MAGRFVRASKYRHVFGKPTRREFCYDNLHISRNAWDTNLVKANPEFLAVNWESSGGGAFAVIPVDERGKAPDQIPLFRGHTAAVLDTDWHPFDDHVIASGSDDGKVFVWRVPEGFTLHGVEGQEEVKDVEPVSRLGGHARKVGQVLFNPAAANILTSASGDFTLKLWDITTGQSPLTLKHGDIVQSLSWNADGSLLVTTSRDKKLRVWDVRQEKPASVVQGHEGAKNSRAVWMGEQNRIATTGFSRMSDRQIGLWEPGRDTPIGGFTNLDSISGVCMPFWDDGTQCLYLAGKGDGNIRYFEYANDKFEYLSEYKSADPQRGIAFLPKRGVNLHENEVMRAYKTVNDSYIEPISFTVPRRAETFQSDIYPPAVGSKPAMSASEWLSGKTAMPPKIDMESIYDGTAPKEVPSDYKPPQPESAAAATPAPKVAAKKEAEVPPAATLASRGPPPSQAEQKASISAMASKFKDNEPEEEDEEDSSSFEEITRPQPKASYVTPKSPIKSAASAKTAEPLKSPTAPTKTTSAPAAAPASRQPSLQSSSAAAAPSGHTASSTSVETSLEQIKALIQSQTDIISKQSEKIGALAGEVEVLKRRVASGSQDQSERIRQLELELEEARS